MKQCRGLLLTGQEHSRNLAENTIEDEAEGEINFSGRSQLLWTIAYKPQHHHPAFLFAQRVMAIYEGKSWPANTLVGQMRTYDTVVLGENG